jgi:hypothetical protein
VMQINQARLEHEADKKRGQFTPSIMMNNVNVPRRAHVKTMAYIEEMSDIWSRCEKWTR